MGTFAWRIEPPEPEDPYDLDFGNFEFFQGQLARAPQGWSPPIDERYACSDEVLRKCLGIDPDSIEWGDLTSAEREQIRLLWEEGDEDKIAYEWLGLQRPDWIKDP